MTFVKYIFAAKNDTEEDIAAHIDWICLFDEKQDEKRFMGTQYKVTITLEKL